MYYNKASFDLFILNINSEFPAYWELAAKIGERYSMYGEGSFSLKSLDTLPFYI